MKEKDIAQVMAKRLSLLALSVAVSAFALYAAGNASGFLGESALFLVRAFSSSGMALAGLSLTGIVLALARAAKSKGRRGLPALVAYFILVLLGFVFFTFGESILAMVG